MTQSRQPRGTPAGGEFAANQHDEATGSLDGAPRIDRAGIERMQEDGTAAAWASDVRGRFDAAVSGLDRDAQFAGVDVRDFLLRIEEDGAGGPDDDPGDDRPEHYAQIALDVIHADADAERHRILTGDRQEAPSVRAGRNGGYSAT